MARFSHTQTQDRTGRGWNGRSGTEGAGDACEWAWRQSALSPSAVLILELEKEECSHHRPCGQHGQGGERTGRKTEESQCGSPPLPFWIFAGSSTIPHFLALTTQTTRRRNLPGLGLGKKDGCHLYDRICRKSTQAINEWPCQLLSYSTPPVSIMGVILFV
jgi:hypothetical protein